MRISRRAAGAAAGVTLALGATTALAAPAANAAQASPAASGSVAGSHHHKLGTKSLVSVLLADRTGYDTNGKDFDILTAGVKAVLTAKRNSAAGRLGNGKGRLTPFIPNDNAFRKLVKGLRGTSPRSEADVFKAVGSLGIPSVEKVLLYHV